VRKPIDSELDLQSGSGATDPFLGTPALHTDSIYMRDGRSGTRDR
jgi:hypothetical protein